jgi:hypothetical protein
MEKKQRSFTPKRLIKQLRLLDRTNDLNRQLHRHTGLTKAYYLILDIVPLNKPEIRSQHCAKSEPAIKFHVFWREQEEMAMMIYQYLESVTKHKDSGSQVVFISALGDTCKIKSSSPTIFNSVADLLEELQSVVDAWEKMK